MANATKNPTKKKNTAAKKPALITRPRETTRMRVEQYLTTRGPGEFTVPEVRDAVGIRQQHAFAIVAAMVKDGAAAKLGDDNKRGKRGTYTTEV